MRRLPISLTVLVVGLAGGGFLLARLRSDAPTPKLEAGLSPAAREAKEARHAADKLYETDPGLAEARYKRFVGEHLASPDPKVQDEVGTARLRLGYLAAKRKDYDQARQTFLETAKEYKGTGAMGSDFGGITDQAAYQAAVCFVAEGKKDSARKALVHFIESYPLSPLVHAAHRRLVQLGGESKPGEYDALLESAVAAQGKYIQFETSVCGPRAVAYLLQKIGKGTFDYKRLAAECGTTDEGTTLEAVRKTLQRHGVDAIGYFLSREDLEKLRAPAILLIQDHYLVFDHLDANKLYAYDPTLKSVQMRALPAKEDPNFQIPVLSLTALDLNSN